MVKVPGWVERWSKGGGGWGPEGQLRGGMFELRVEDVDGVGLSTLEALEMTEETEWERWDVLVELC